MVKIAFFISSQRQNTEAFHWCLHQAKEKGGCLLIFYVVERENEGGRLILEEMERQARTFQVQYETSLKEGSYLSICEEMGNHADVATIVFLEKKGSLLKKLFEGRESDQLKDRICCEMKVYPSK